jgi:hypothetical protein
LDETRAAEKRRRELRLEARKTVPTSGLVTLAGLRFMTRTKGGEGSEGGRGETGEATAKGGREGSKGRGEREDSYRESPIA